MTATAYESVGQQVYDCNGQTVGRVTAFYRYPTDLHAPWGVAEVTRGHLFRSVHLVDLRGAVATGDVLTVAHAAPVIEAAPTHQAFLGNTLSERAAREVLEHYGRSSG